VAIFLKDSFKFEILDISLCDNVDILAIKLFSGKFKVSLVLIYNPPCTKHSIYNCFEKIFSSNILGKDSIIIGDFNIDWAKHSLFKDKFETLMSLNHYTQLITNFTRLTISTKTIIDLIFSSSDTLVTASRKIESDISDHFAISCIINIQPVKISQQIIRKRNFRNFDHIEFFKLATSVNFHHVE
jgi:hypothetical protein